MKLDITKYKITNNKFKLKEYKTDDSNGYSDKEEALDFVKENIEELEVLQDKLYAENKNSLVIIIQAMDAAGKDGVVKHVMSGVNPQGCQVTSFKQPTSTELDHDYLWRVNAALPERGRIGIFNRSYYEDVLVVRVHNLLSQSQLDSKLIGKNIWEDRFKQIKNYESYLNQNGIKVIKIFLNVSKEEQKQRILARIENPEKNWKFNLQDIKEREYWDDYMNAFEDAIKNTSTKDSPWYIVPADKKWFARLLVSNIIVEELKQLDPKYPVLSKEELNDLMIGKDMLLKEDGSSPTENATIKDTKKESKKDTKKLSKNKDKNKKDKKK